MVGLVPVDPVLALVGTLLWGHGALPRISVGVQHDRLVEKRDHRHTHRHIHAGRMQGRPDA